MKINKKHIVIFVVIAVLITLIVWIVYHNKDLEVNKFNVKSENVPVKFDGFRIVQVSDLHNSEFGDNNEILIATLQQTDADIIVITGDMIDSRNTDVDVAVSFAQKAVSIAPVYYVNGNHEKRVPEAYEKLKQGFTEAGVTILENKTTDITIGNETITLIGINDSTFAMELVDDTMGQNVARQLENIVPDNDNYKVLLAHRPEYFDVYADKVDLVLSGHAHGGQFIIPFVGGLVAPGQGLLPKYYDGLYKDNTTSMIVSRGLGNSIFPFRINNRPVIVVAELMTSSDE